MPKTSKQMEVTGTVERATLESRKPFHTSYYSPNGEHDKFYLDVALRLDDGTAVYFKTPAARRVIAFGGGAAVVMYFVDGGAADWMVEVGGEAGNCCATAGKSNSNRLEATVEVGDRITVRGSLKTEIVSRAGKPYRVLNRVRRVML
jgi:hypothetical protein